MCIYKYKMFPNFDSRAIQCIIIWILLYHQVPINDKINFK